MNDDTRLNDTTHRAHARLVMDALAALREKTGIEGRLANLEPRAPRDYQADAAVDLVYEGGTSRYLVECKVVDRKSQIDQVSRQLGSTGCLGLLIAPYISKELAEHCRATDLQFIDTKGNAYLNAPGLFVLITGEKGQGHQPAPRAAKGLTNSGGLRVVFALLAKPELINAGFKGIAEHAGVSLGTAYNAIADLNRRGYVMKRASGEGRMLMEWRRLMDEWVINYPTTLRSKLASERFTAADPDWWKKINLKEFDCAWGSEIAAAQMTKYLKPSTQTIYVDSTEMGRLVNVLAKKHRLRPDPEGEIEIIEKFWKWPPETSGDLAPALLVYADLIALVDPRAQETAHILKERFIDPAFD